jgi:hypothetical protein
MLPTGIDVRRDCTYAATFRVSRRGALTVRARFLGTGG